MTATTAEMIREQRLRRWALRLGFSLAKANRADVWFLYDRTRLARTAKVFYSHDEVEAALRARAPDAG